jgi:L-asparagine transporter-like permease
VGGICYNRLVVRRNGRMTAEVRFAQRAALFGAVALALFLPAYHRFLYTPRSAITISALVLFGAAVIAGGYSGLRWWREAKRSRPNGGPVPPELKYRLQTIWVTVLTLAMLTYLVQQLATTPSPYTAVFVVPVLVGVLLGVRVAVKWRREAARQHTVPAQPTAGENHLGQSQESHRGHSGQ